MEICKEKCNGNIWILKIKNIRDVCELDVYTIAERFFLPKYCSSQQLNATSFYNSDG